jgi:hypothetical protein
MAIVGLCVGIGLGLWYGWALDPVEYVDTELTYLHPAYQQEYILMVSEAYAVDRDLDAARARIAMLDLPYPAATVGDLAERAIDESQPPMRVQALVRLALALGVEREAFDPIRPALSDTP